MRDAISQYIRLFPEAVIHSQGEYFRGDAHTNDIESFWSGIKRGYMDYISQYEKKAPSPIRQ